MATVIEASGTTLAEASSAHPDQEHILLRGISWSTYEALLRELEGNRRLSLTYDNGDLEIMSPSPRHEWGKVLLGRMVEAYTEELGIAVCSLGSTTFKFELKQKGVEPDECYYLQHEPQVRGKDELKLGDDPPPDLAIEVDVASRVLKRLPIYAALGFPEVWQYVRGEIKVHVLGDDGAYAVSRQSGCLPDLPMANLEEFLRQRGQTDETTWIRSFRAWVRGLGS